jgi:isocitrate dehydrogenase
LRAVLIALFFVFLAVAGHSSGIADSSWDSLRRTKVFLKAPITTPTGSGYKSLNVTIRKTLGLFANVRPCNSYTPFVDSRFPKLDVVIIRENEEDLYAGIEHRQTNEVFQALKLITRPGTEKIVRYAFEYARRHNRKEVCCMIKDNIMKMSDGLFYKVFEEIGKHEYPDIKRSRMIIDIGAAMLADQPEKFDVVLSLNLYADILSDIVAQVSGSVGLGGSANIGDHVAMFEAIHGSAPDIAGKNMANPSGLLLGAVQMLVHIGQPQTAGLIYNAWLKTLEDGMHTADVYKKNSEYSKKLVGTKEFTKCLIDNLGKTPAKLPAANFPAAADHEETLAAEKASKEVKRWTPPPEVKILTGVDIFIDSQAKDPMALGAKLKEAAAKVSGNKLELQLITNRGVKVWPQVFPETFIVDVSFCSS